MLNVKDHKKLGLANTKNEKKDILRERKKHIYKQGKPNDEKKRLLDYKREWEWEWEWTK